MDCAQVQHQGWTPVEIGPTCDHRETSLYPCALTTIYLRSVDAVSTTLNKDVG